MLRSLTCTVLLAAALFAPATADRSSSPPAGVSPEVYRVLQDIRRADTGQLAVSEEDGKFLRTLVAASRTQRALEIGAASGYSAIWIGLGLRETGGRLVALEYDPQRAREAAANISRAGLEGTVTVVGGDAFKEIPRLEGPLDFVFLDAWKPDYKKFFDLVTPRLSRGGLFVAHNVVNKRNEMLDFLTAIETHPDYYTTIVSPSAEGVSLSWKRR